MRKYKILIVAASFVLFACSKGGESPTPTPPTPPPVVIVEADIAFKVEIPVSTEIDYTKIYGAIGSTQAINVNVTSALPKDGVTIDVKVTKDADNSTVFTNSITSTNAANAINITSLSPGVLSTVTVLVTSKSKSSNTATKTFKIASKS
jgi:hypothetical protein